MRHKNVVQLLGVVMQPLCMVLEFCGGGDLYSWIHAAPPPSSPSDLAQRERLALDMAEGMEFLHATTPPIIHRDLKSPNVLLSLTGGHLQCKIADFGLSRGLVWNDLLEGKVVDNPIWLAPEILRHHKYTEKVDVYAFGVIMWELLSAQDFFGHISFMSTIEDMIKNGTPSAPLTPHLLSGERPPIPPTAPPFMAELIAQCWADDARVRPSFEQLCQRLRKRDARAKEAPAPARTVAENYDKEEQVERERRLRERADAERVRTEKLQLKAAYTPSRKKELPPPPSAAPLPTSVAATPLAGVTSPPVRTGSKPLPPPPPSKGSAGAASAPPQGQGPPSRPTSGQMRQGNFLAQRGSTSSHGPGAAGAGVRTSGPPPLM